MPRMIPSLAAAVLMLCACEGVGLIDVKMSKSNPGVEPAAPGAAPGAVPGAEAPAEPLPAFVAAPARMRALTREQLGNTLRELLGTPLQLAVPESVDLVAENFSSIGAARISLTGNTIEKLETLAFSVSEQVFADPARRAALLGCTPSSANDPCVKKFLQAFGARAWRRPLTAPELDALAQKSAELSVLLADNFEGPRHALAAILISPNFLYLPEVAEPDPLVAGRRRYTSYEMASRLSYALWNSGPDAALLAAAESGALLTEPGVRLQAQRMLAVDAKSQPAIRAYFAEYLGLGALDRLNKDATVLPRMSPTLGSSMRGELERALDDLVFTRSADIRELFTSRSTFVNAELAGLYGLPAPTGGEPTAVTIQASGTNLWGNADSFHFVSRTMSGDGEIIARVDALTSTRPWAKAAVMIREDLTPGARHAIVAVTPGNGTAFKFRAVRDGATDYKLGPAQPAPYWVKLERKGAALTGSVSADGQTWVMINTLTLALPTSVHVGVAYTNEDNSSVQTAQFSNLKVTASASAAWTRQNIGDIATGSSTFQGSAGFQASPFPQGQARVGLFGFSGILASNSKASATSPTARGLFVRERLLCQHLAPPPPNVATTLPAEVPGAARTVRERLAVHRANPSCNACHKLMDPIGLALESYDALGEYRTTELGVSIDTNGDIDGQTFVGLEGLMTLLKNSPRANECLVRQLYRHSTAHLESFNEERVIKDLAAPLTGQGTTFSALLLSIVTSDGFRFATQPN